MTGKLTEKQLEEALAVLDDVLMDLPETISRDSIRSFLAARLAEAKCWWTGSPIQGFAAADEERSHLLVLAVGRPWQHQGIGRSLLKDICRDLEQEGIARLTLNALESIVPFYRAAGFLETGEAVEASGLRVIPMEKLLLEDLLGITVTVEVEHGAGSYHELYPDLVYPVNTGSVCINGQIHEAYIIGPKEPLDSFTGMVSALIYRRNSDTVRFAISQTPLTKEEIVSEAGALEQYDDTVIRLYEGN